MSDHKIEALEIGLYEQYLEDLEKKYYQGVIKSGPDKGDAYYSKLPNEMEEEATQMVKEFMDRNS
jgi:hypothetical protein